MLQRLRSSYSPSSSEPTSVPLPFLCQRKPATTQSAVRACLTLIIARLPGWYGAVLRLGDHAVEAGALEPRQPLRRQVAVARHRRQMDWRLHVRQQALQPLATLALRRRRAGPRRRRRAHRRRRTTPASPAASFATRDAAGCSRNCSASKSSPCGVAMTISPSSDAVRPGAAKQRVVQVGKVAIERPQIAALDEHVVAAAKDDGAKAVPLRLVEEPVAGGKLRRELREHRLDRRIDGKRHPRIIARIGQTQAWSATSIGSK